MLEGAHFTIAPTIFAKLFGPKNGIRVFSVGFSFAGLSSLIQIVLNKYFLSQIGFGGMCQLYTVFCFIALVTLLVIFEETKFEPKPTTKKKKPLLATDDFYMSISSATQASSLRLIEEELSSYRSFSESKYGSSDDGYQSSL